MINKRNNTNNKRYEPLCTSRMSLPCAWTHNRITYDITHQQTFFCLLLEVFIGMLSMRKWNW